MATGGAFFDHPDTTNAMAGLARADRLTVVAGAGVSVESGLPTWGGLVHALLVNEGEPLLGKQADLANAFAEWTIVNDGLLGGAAVARAQGATDRDVQQVLYDHGSRTPLPGPSARALAELALETKGVDLCTQNYDDLIALAMEEHLKERGSEQEVHRIVSEQPPPEGEPAVYHLHGLVTPNEVRGAIVLSEGDYFGMSDRAWQARWTQERLAESACLFVGTSMSDPNLLRYLYQAAKFKSSRSKHLEHVAVLPRQADTWLNQETPPEKVRRARDDCALKRWEKLGFRVLQPDYYSDSAQLLFEVLQQRRDDGLGSYADRLRRWQGAFDRDLLGDRDPRRFRRQQHWLQCELDRYQEQVRRRLATSLRGERLQISLWVRQPGDTLLLLAASDRVHRDPATLQPVEINGPSEWISVQAYRQGSALLADLSADTTSRWSTVMGIPVSIRHSSYGRLQVGVVTLAGTEPQAKSSLIRAAPEAGADIRASLETLAAALLTPSEG